MSTPAVLERDIAGLFPFQVQACIAGPEMAIPCLSQEESACVDQAIAARRREYALGRAALKQALGRLGAAVASIPSLPDRSPRLPPGYVASLTHCGGFCAAVAARKDEVAALGLDAERAEPLPANLEALVHGPYDDAADGHARSALGPLWLTVLFSAKEAFYKCRSCIVATQLDFSDLGVVFSEDLGLDGGRFDAVFGPDGGQASSPCRFRGAWRLKGGLVLTAVWPERDPVSTVRPAPHAPAVCAPM